MAPNKCATCDKCFMQQISVHESSILVFFCSFHFSTSIHRKWENLRSLNMNRLYVDEHFDEIYWIFG